MRCPSLNNIPPPPPGKTGWPWTEESPALPAKMDDGSPWPKISIVTPSLNQGQFIEETIRSVLLQGYPFLEYIIIDGGSTDESIDIIKKYESWPIYWVTEPDSGQPQAINKGFTRATGDIVSWLNSDDTYKPNALKAVAEILVNNPSDLFIYGDVDFIDADSNFLRKFGTGEFDLINDIYTNMIPQQAAFWRKAIFESIGYLDEKFQHPFDNDFFIRVGTIYKIRYVPVPLANYRLHPSSKGEIGLGTIRFFLEYLAILDKFFQRTDIPQNVYNHKKKILSYWHERTAHKYFELASKSSARKHFWKAITLTPLRMQNITLIANVIDTLIGSKFGSLIQVFSKRLRKLTH